MTRWPNLPPNYDTSDEQRIITDLSRWIDAYNRHKPHMQQLWERTGKVGEEAGEVYEAMIGYSDQNPRKGQTHKIGDVRTELLDVAVTALGAVEHIDGNEGTAMEALAEHLRFLAERADLRW